MTSTQRDPRAEMHDDETIRAALAATSVFEQRGEYVTRYVVMAETVYAGEDGFDHYRTYKIVPPAQTRGDTCELLQTGLDCTQPGAGLRLWA